MNTLIKERKKMRFYHLGILLALFALNISCGSVQKHLNELLL